MNAPTPHNIGIFRTTAFSVLIAFALARTAPANLLQDATFTSVTYSGGPALSSTRFGMFGSETGSTLTVENWTTAGYNFVYAPGTADTGKNTTGAIGTAPNEAPGQFNTSSGYGDTYLWGSGNGGASSLPTDPFSGNFIAADGAYETSAISQTLTGLTVGQTYALTFYWAGAQQESFNGATTDNWTVSMGGESYTTPTVDVATNSSSNWQEQTYQFTAFTSTETLSFLAAGTPTGEPPFSLLGGLDLEVVPEFSNWMIFAGFGAACLVFETMRRRRRQFDFALATA